MRYFTPKKFMKFYITIVVCVTLMTDRGEDYDDDEAGDVESDSYKAISPYQSSYHDYDEYHYGYKPKKKKTFVPVFVPEKEKKKSKIFLPVSVIFVGFCSH